MKKTKKAKQKRRLGFPCVVPGMGNLVFAKITAVSQILLGQQTPYYTQFQDSQGREIRQYVDWVSRQAWIIIKYEGKKFDSHRQKGGKVLSVSISPESDLKQKTL